MRFVLKLYRTVVLLVILILFAIYGVNRFQSMATNRMQVATQITNRVAQRLQTVNRDMLLSDGALLQEIVTQTVPSAYVRTPHVLGLTISDAESALLYAALDTRAFKDAQTVAMQHNFSFPADTLFKRTITRRLSNQIALNIYFQIVTISDFNSLFRDGLALLAVYLALLFLLRYPARIRTR